MALMDEFKEERKAIFENGTLKQKVSYIWDYYKWHIIIPLVLIISIVWFIVHTITAPDIILNGVLMNVYKPEEPTITTAELLEDFYEEQKINPKEQEANLNANLYLSVENGNTSYETLQALMAWHAADSLDFISGDTAAMTELAYRGYFSDLRELLSEEQLEAYEPYFLYMDRDFYEMRSEKLNEFEDVDDMEYPDCTKPEDMVDPIPVMIDMKQSQQLTELYSGNNNIIALGITANVFNKEMTLEFIDFLMN